MEVDSFIQHQMDSLQIAGLSIAIVENGQIVYYKAKGIKNFEHDSVDTNTLFEAGSMTKPVFAYAVHKLIEEDVLSLDTPLYKYCPYEVLDNDERYKFITARMTLNHTSGLPNWRYCSCQELNIDFMPGTQYSYSGEGFEYLGIAVKRLTDRKLEDIIRDYVFTPFSINNSYLIKNEYVVKHLADGYKDNKEWGKNCMYTRPHVAFSLCTESKEYAKFLIAIMQESTKPNSTFQKMAVPQLEIELQKFVCLGIFMEQTPFGIKYYHAGNTNNRYNSKFEFYKDSQIGYVYFMNCHKGTDFIKRLNEFIINGK